MAEIFSIINAVAEGNRLWTGAKDIVQNGPEIRGARRIFSETDIL